MLMINQCNNISNGRVASNTIYIWISHFNNNWLNSNFDVYSRFGWVTDLGYIQNDIFRAISELSDPKSGLVKCKQTYELF